MVEFTLQSQLFTRYGWSRKAKGNKDKDKAEAKDKDKAN